MLILSVYDIHVYLALSSKRRANNVLELQDKVASFMLGQLLGLLLGLLHVPESGAAKRMPKRLQWVMCPASVTM